MPTIDGKFSDLGFNRALEKGIAELERSIDRDLKRLDHLRRVLNHRRKCEAELELARIAEVRAEAGERSREAKPPVGRRRH